MPTNPKIYFDSCCFIDMARLDIHAIESMPQNDVWFCKKLLEASRQGDLQVFTSLLTLNECLYVRNENDQRLLDENVKRLFSGMLTSGKSGVTPVQPTIFVSKRARDLVWEHGLHLRPMDSLHVASALEMGCTEFITCDAKIHSQAAKLNDLGLAVIFANQTNLLPPKFKQLTI